MSVIVSSDKVLELKTLFEKTHMYQLSSLSDEDKQDFNKFSSVCFSFFIL